MKKRYLFLAIVLALLILLFILGAITRPMPLPQLNNRSAGWSEIGPVIKYQDVIPETLWNDPSVIKEEKYIMYLSGGNPLENPITVKIYRATSDDGKNWNINSNPILEPGTGWDNQRVETPSVIKVNGVYHMYYSGCDAPCNDASYSIGHATSEDGTTWTKDPANPIISPSDDPTKWGFYTTAEPGVVYSNNKFYLYYSSAKSNSPEPGAPFGILLATSHDGTNFVKQGAVYTLTNSYDKKEYRGYSTPMVYVSNGVFHMYHDVVYNPDGFDQVAISSATSTDGIHFQEDELNIVHVEQGWKSKSVLAPTALEENGKINLWFSAQQDNPFDFNIGYAEKESI